jgi:hypothetical protein
MLNRWLREKMIYRETINRGKEDGKDKEEDYKDKIAVDL